MSHYQPTHFNYTLLLTAQGLGKFHDIDTITMFADYRYFPYVLPETDVECSFKFQGSAIFGAFRSS